jgi:hypothetical protein
VSVVLRLIVCTQIQASERYVRDAGEIPEHLYPNQLAILTKYLLSHCKFEL